MLLAIQLLLLFSLGVTVGIWITLRKFKIRYKALDKVIIRLSVLLLSKRFLKKILGEKDLIERVIRLKEIRAKRRKNIVKRSSEKDFIKRLWLSNRIKEKLIKNYFKSDERTKEWANSRVYSWGFPLLVFIISLAILIQVEIKPVKIELIEFVFTGIIVSIGRIALIYSIIRIILIPFEIGKLILWEPKRKELRLFDKGLILRRVLLIASSLNLALSLYLLGLVVISIMILLVVLMNTLKPILYRLILEIKFTLNKDSHGT